MVSLENCCEFNYIGKSSEARLERKETNGKFCEVTKVIKASGDKNLN